MAGARWQASRSSQTKAAGRGSSRATPRSSMVPARKTSVATPDVYSQSFFRRKLRRRGRISCAPPSPMTSAVTRTLVARLAMSDLEGDERVALAVRLGDLCRGGGRDLEATVREERAQVSHEPHHRRGAANVRRDQRVEPKGVNATADSMSTVEGSRGRRSRRTGGRPRPRARERPSQAWPGQAKICPCHLGTTESRAIPRSAWWHDAR